VTKLCSNSEHFSVNSQDSLQCVYANRKQVPHASALLIWSSYSSNSALNSSGYANMECSNDSLADSLAMAEAAMRVKTQALDVLMGELQSLQALNSYLAGVGTAAGVSAAYLRVARNVPLSLKFCNGNVIAKFMVRTH
jgi:hypothetical protein